MSNHHLTTTPSLNIISIMSFVEKLIVISITGILLILLLINSYLRLNAEYNETLILNQYLLMPLFLAFVVIVIMRFFNPEICWPRYPTHFFIFILALLITMIIAVLNIWNIFPNAAGRLTNFTLMLFTLITIAMGIIPFILLYNSYLRTTLHTVHTLTISFIFIPISMMILSPLVLNHLPLTLLNIYQFDIHIFSQQLKLATLLTLMGIFIGALITFIYSQLLKRIEWMDIFLQWFSTAIFIAAIIYCVVKDREIFLIIAVSFW